MKKIQLLSGIFLITIVTYLLSIMTANLSSFPGLHADEAWVGLNANNIIYNGVRTVHGVNTYTSSFYSWLVSLNFQVWGVSIFSLRFLGVFLNLLSFMIVVLNFCKYVDKRSVFLFFALLLSCSSLLLFPRIAWEVCALQSFFLSIKFSLLLKHLKGNKLLFIDILIFLMITFIGVINHFIFIFESLGLALAAFFLHLHYANKSTFELLYLAILSLGGVILIYWIKPLIDDDIFQVYSYIILGAFLIGLVATSLIFLKTKIWIFERSNKFNCKHKKWFYITNLIFFASVLVLLMSRFLSHHHWSFLGTISGIVVIEKLSSNPLGTFNTRCLEVAWVTFIAVFIVRGLQKIIQKSIANQLQVSVFFYLYTLSCLLFVSLAPGNSDRYYIIPSFLFIVSFPLVVINHHHSHHFRYLWIVLYLGLSLTIGMEQYLLWKNILSTDIKPPIVVTYNNQRDYSSHFLKQDELLRFLREKQICQIDIETTYFIYFPLDFYFLTQEFPCDRTQVVRIEFCPHCWGYPKYFKIIPRKSEL